MHWQTPWKAQAQLSRPPCAPCPRATLSNVLLGAGWTQSTVHMAGTMCQRLFVRGAAQECPCPPGRPSLSGRGYQPPSHGRAPERATGADRSKSTLLQVPLRKGTCRDPVLGPEPPPRYPPSSCAWHSACGRHHLDWSQARTADSWHLVRCGKAAALLRRSRRELLAVLAPCWRSPVCYPSGESLAAPWAGQPKPRQRAFAQVYVP